MLTTMDIDLFIKQFVFANQHIKKMSTCFLMIDAPTTNQSTIYVPLNPWTTMVTILLIFDYKMKRFKQIDYKKMSIPKTRFVKGLGKLDCFANGAPPRAIYIA